VPQTEDTPSLYTYPRPASIRSWRNDVYEALSDAGLSKIAERWNSCCDTPKTKIKPAPGVTLPRTAETVYVCKGDHRHEAEIYSQSCDLRICPECARRQAARLVHRYLDFFNDLAHQHHKTYRFRHIVFTSPYALTDPDIRKKYLCGFKQVYKTMSAVMSEKCPGWKTSQGFLVGAEFGETGHKLHYHVIHYGQYLNQSDLSRAWKEATGGEAYVVFVRGFPYPGHSIEETLREVLKYCVKFYSQDETSGQIEAIPAHLMPCLARVLEKSRRVRTYGLFFKIPEPDGRDHLCATCGSKMIGIPVDYFVTFCNTGFLPLEWKSQISGGLDLRPADKSFSLSSSLDPPDTKIIAARQLELSKAMSARKKDDDYYKKR